MPVPVSPDAVLDALEKLGGRPAKPKDLTRALGLSADDRASIRAALAHLAAEGRVVQLEGRRYVVPKKGTVLKGTVQRKATGSAWFLPDEPRRKDAFLPPGELAGIMDGDRVLCRIEEAPKGPVGTIVKVLARGRTTVTGVLRREGAAQFVEVEGNVLSGVVIVPAGAEGNADKVVHGSVVEVLIVEPPTPVTTAVGRVVRSLGKPGQIQVEVERILAEKGVVRAFPPEVLAQAEGFADAPTDKDAKGREDVRKIPLCTIDGETAKDFDDAVWGEVRGDDVRVLVAIADVSHYVQQGAPLDVEAARRATSIYYPGAVVPMLPEKLSNGLCSLKPNVDRLCFCAEFTVTRKGERKKARFFEGVMHSNARLTYTLTQKYFDGDKDAAASIPAAVRQSLDALKIAASALRKNRHERGSLDFDLPETVIALDDDGEPIRIHPLERLYAHKLIEDLMVAANEVVAEEFEERGWPSIYRVHAPPDEEKLQRFLKLVRETTGGTKLQKLKGKAPTSKDLSRLMESLVDHPARRTLDSLLLRSMMQAKYQADNIGHYGLGSTAYLHFTSPIRRYPDLVVHRLLRDRLAGKKKRGPEAEEDLHLSLIDIAQQSSDQERKATDVERAMDALYAAWFMRDKVGEVLWGTVASCAEFGAFVRLDQHHVEGLLHVSDLPPDYYAFDEVRLTLVGERSGRRFTVGDRIEVRVANVDVARRQVAFVLPDAPARAASSSAPSRRGEEAPSRKGRLPRGPDELRALANARGKKRGAPDGSRGGRKAPRGSRRR